MTTSLVLLNDDGLSGLGDLRKMRVLLREIGYVATAAVHPRKNTTGYGGRLRVGKPVEYTKNVIDGIPFYCVDGFPAECVYFALQQLEVGALLAVNRGLNLGTDIFNSASTLAIMQAWWLGMPGMCVSVDASEDGINPQQLKEVMRYALQELDVNPGPYLLNVPVDLVDPKPRMTIELCTVERDTVVSMRSGTFTIEDRATIYPHVGNSDGAIIAHGFPSLVDLRSTILWRFR